MSFKVSEALATPLPLLVKVKATKDLSTTSLTPVVCRNANHCDHEHKGAHRHTHPGFVDTRLRRTAESAFSSRQRVTQMEHARMRVALNVAGLRTHVRSHAAARRRAVLP